MLHNEEFHNLDCYHVVRGIRSASLKQVDHAYRMEDSRKALKMLTEKPVRKNQL